MMMMIMLMMGHFTHTQNVYTVGIFEIVSSTFVSSALFSLSC